MDWLKRMNGAMAYIEEHLTGDIDYREVARIACCSEYHFKRMFSFIAGVTLSEYIRRRRLTLAAFELKNSQMKVIDVAVKYGYHSPDAFTRAFQSVHGITPTEARNNGHSLKAYPAMTFHISIKGGTEMNYRMEQKEAFRVVGMKKRVKLVHRGTNTDITDMLGTISDETYMQIENLSTLEPGGILNVCTNFSEGLEDEGELDYYIAAATIKKCPEHLVELEIPTFTWAVFTVEGSWEDVQEMWGRIYSDWFPTSDYEHAEGPEILSSANEKSEIWIPVVKK
ncbi:AraC family transcriptional regulator [Halalkalibacterium halodurans]|uniref:Transcriptional regulator (AraC/XylS family) n=1 Tax=Halalkalibacterium halodurans (strain ATCC BAA-125 / DSM 18197 / FERM 7344 / JCM 9153 / C-125) TaxID=272558 RepID=Q9KF91_HALH5|nr:AraC family transcriptional regulator [Halalkalibacterium halodurans]MED4124546.1 AraC family transcriptional regulator [Halalkalibacterium halodurans]MED4173196.1 AraC family transcriptional regulator [Halalkalibacterium halodurans]BAB04313.1 transcriptional regulator (AraC/XylS family) [Halalkalibacterium halodurans C-125]